MTSSLVRVDDLVFRYGESDFELRVPELEIPRASSAAIIGPSGSGKTTLLHLIAGISLPASGKIRTDGVDITSLSEKARRDFRIQRVGLVFQEFELLEYLSVADNVLLPYRINPSLALTREVEDRVAEVAEQVGIADKLARYPRQLSQGERQRVAVCRAVITKPSVLMADEPTGNLDPLNKGKVLDILFDYAEASGTTLLTVTHDHDVLERLRSGRGLQGPRSVKQQRLVDFKDLVA